MVMIFIKVFRGACYKYTRSKCHALRVSLELQPANVTVYQFRWNVATGADEQKLGGPRCEVYLGGTLMLPCLANSSYMRPDHWFI